MALTESAQTYLQALDKKRKMAAARGGPQAEQAIVNEQTKQANYLAGDDDKLKTAAANRLRKPPVGARSAFEQQSREANVKPQGPPAPAKTFLDQGTPRPKNPNRSTAADYYRKNK